MGEDYIKFFKVIRKNMKELPQINHLPLNDQYLIKHIGRYNVKKTPENTISLRRFSDKEVHFLQTIHKKDLTYLQTLEKTLNLKDKTLRDLLNFDINEGALYLKGNKTPWDFKNALAGLLKKCPLLFFLAEDSTLPLLVPDLTLLLENHRKTLVEASESIIPARLYLFEPAPLKELTEHTEEKKNIAKKITERQKLIEKLSVHKNNPSAIKWTEQAQKQLNELEIVEEILRALISYKQRNFTDSQKEASEGIRTIETYQEKYPHQMPRLQASLNALLAKIDRSIWRQEKDLIFSATHYKKSLHPIQGLPKAASLWSNYGALLNNYGEWLFFEGRTQEALEKHKEALKAHQRSQELSLEASWLLCDINKDSIKRDYGRGVYLIARAKYDISSKDKNAQETFQTELQEALLFFTTEEKDPKKILCVTHLFEGIILQDMGNLEGALTCYTHGLKNYSKHRTLLYRRATIYFSMEDFQKALEEAKSSKKAFKERGIHTPEDKYRFALVKTLIKNIQKELS